MNPFTEPTVASPLAHNPFDLRKRLLRTESKAAAEHAAQAGATATPAVPSEAAQPSAATSPLRRRQGPIAAIVLAAVCCMVGLVMPHNAHATDVNQASVDQLKNVRGIGPKTAQIIIDERTRGGSYESFSDLSDRVKGIGPKKSVALQQAGLTIGGGSKTPADTPSSSSKPPKKPGR